jgi:hypothetical protein
MSNLLNQLISEFQSREESGFKKYGTTMDRTDLSLSEWVQHALEEAMDLTQYLYKIKQQLNDTQRFPDYQEANTRISESINTGGEASDTRTAL